MDDRQLKDLMDYLARSSFIEFELERDGFKLRLVKAGGAAQAPAAAVALVPQGAPAPPEPPGGSAPAPPHTPSPGAPPTVLPPEAPLEAITSPMVGTFFRAPNSNADPFVEVGDVVQLGQVICIVEAMKLMNEIEADRSGEIAEIPVANGQPVEFGETLFRLRPLP